MRSKYHNKKVVIDGHKFDSQKEGRYYLYLKNLLEQGAISNLRMQVPYEVIPAIWEDEVKHLKTKDKTVKKCVQRATYYLADFVYTVTETGKEEVIDVKSAATKKKESYRLKKKMMRAFNGIDVIEV